MKMSWSASECCKICEIGLQMRVVKAFQAAADDSHPNSLTTSTAERLRASVRRLKIARELEQQKSS